MHPHSPTREWSHNSECSLDNSINLHISSVLHFWIDILESMSLSQNYTHCPNMWQHNCISTLQKFSYTVTLQLLITQLVHLGAQCLLGPMTRYLIWNLHLTLEVLSLKESGSVLCQESVIVNYPYLKFYCVCTHLQQLNHFQQYPDYTWSLSVCVKVQLFLFYSCSVHTVHTSAPNSSQNLKHNRHTVILTDWRQVLGKFPKTLTSAKTKP